MSIEDSEANLYRRSQFVVEHDTTATEVALRSSLESDNVRRRALESLDAEWNRADLNEPVRDAADKLGHLYVQSTAITPHGFYEDTKAIKLPLRLGSRVREVFYLGDEMATVTAARGSLLMYRTLGEKDHVQETGFYTLLATVKDQPAPILTYGSLDTLGLTSRYLSALEIILCGAGEWLGRTHARVSGDDLMPFDVGKAIQRRIDDAKTIAGFRNGKTWQEVFNKLHATKDSLNNVVDSPYRDAKQLFMDDVFVKTVEERRWRKDKVSIGAFRGNEMDYIEPTSAKLAISGALQTFFNSATNPIATRPDQCQAAVADLEHGIAIERLDAEQISEIDIAKSIIRHAVKDTSKAVPTRIINRLSSHTVDAITRRSYIKGLSFDDYPETKAILDEIYSDYETPADQLGSDGNDWSRNLRMMLRQDATKGEWSTLFNGEREFTQMVKRIAALTEIKPSPEAFPYD